MFRMAVTPKEIYITFTVCSKSACIAQTLITEYAHVRSRCRSHGKSYGFALNEKLSNWQTLASHTLGSRKVNISSYRVISVQYNDSARSYDRFHKRSLATWRAVFKSFNHDRSNGSLFCPRASPQNESETNLRPRAAETICTKYVTVISQLQQTCHVY